jgi:hypothetical protein
MRGITPLVAASTNAKETRMDFEKLYNELKAANATLTAELSATSAKVTELTAQLANKKKDPEEEEEEKEKLTAALSLPMSARARERLSAANELSLFRANVRSITGEASDARAIGVLTAWKGGHGEVAKLSSRVAELEGEKLKTEFDQLVAVEGKDKVAPAEQAEFKTKMLSITGGKLCAETITATRACLSITGPKISAAGGRPDPGAASDAAAYRQDLWPRSEGPHEEGRLKAWPSQRHETLPASVTTCIRMTSRSRDLRPFTRVLSRV